MKGTAPIAIVVAAAGRRAAGTSVERRAQFPGRGAADRAGRAGLEHARRLWRAIFVRPRRVFRHRRLCHRDPAGALRRQCLAGLCRSASRLAPLVGAVIGALTFRSGLRGSYFALVTLAFAEVLRIIASVAPITGAGVGTLIKLDLRPGSVPVPEPRARSIGSSSRWSRVSLVIARLIERRVRRLAGGGARERGCRQGARRRCDARSSSRP